MPYSQSYLDFVMEQLGNVLPDVSARSMFGGVGIYSQGLFFALIAGDVLYFYANDSNRADFETLGMQQFGKNYYEVPINILEDTEALEQWTAKAVTAAASKKPSKKSTNKNSQQNNTVSS